METNVIAEEMKILEAEINESNEMYVQLLDKMISFDEELRKCQKELVLLRLEVMKAKLEHLKLEQELKNRFLELEGIDEELGLECEMEKNNYDVDNQA